MHLGLAGYFKIEAHDLSGKSRVLADWFPNLILNSGLDQLGTGGVLGYAMVGGSSSAPDVAQTGLITPVANTSNVISSGAGVEVGSGYAYARRVYRFGTGAAAGNLSEIGVGWGTNNCFSRALILDGLGVPTTITVLSTEVLDVTYEVRTYWPTTDSTYTLTISGNNYDFTSRSAAIGSWADKVNRFFAGGAGSYSAYYDGIRAHTGGTIANLGDITTAYPSLTSVGDFGYGHQAYISSSYERKMTMYASPFDGNSPYSAFHFNIVGGIFKCFIDPAIPKDNTKSFTMNFKLSWSRRILP